ncbi:hypothetical protein ACROYT_G038763 [Oculina patagonica]
MFCSSGFIISAFVFNDFVDQGVKGVLTAVGNVNNSLIEVQLKVNAIKDDLVDMDSTIIDARDCPGITDAGQDLIDNVRSKIGDIVTTVVKIKKVNLPDINEYIHDIEYYRWWSTFGTLCMNTLTCILMIYAILRRSRCGFILAILGGIMCLVLIWSGAGIDLAVAIGMSDLCVNPKETVYYYIRNQPELKNTGVVNYYVDCPEDEDNPYQKYADRAKEHLDEASIIFSSLMKLGLKLPVDCQDDLSQCNNDLNQSQASMSVIMKNLDCKYAHQQFESAQCFVCYGVVVGVAELLLMTLIIGFLLIVNLSLVLPVLLRTPSSKKRKKRSILDMCVSDSPIGTPYHSISEDDNRAEAVPLIPSAPPPPTYNSTHRSSMEFHSFEDSWMPGRYNTGAANPGFPAAPQPTSSAGNSDSFNPNTRRGQITSMAF